ncbi:MAG: glutamate-5-semialdehyde dehydrogenase, partial [Flavobacteriaceae bacterium]|nr:glutamate-5-semialdehyde dehydrogenase [Flavobacteriaceae bacterium]
MKLLDTNKKNNVLKSMIRILGENRSELLAANKEDLDLFKRDDQAMYDRLVIDDSKVDGMIASVQSVMQQEDPVGKVISDREVHDGLKVINKTAPFG